MTVAKKLAKPKQFSESDQLRTLTLKQDAELRKLRSDKTFSDGEVERLKEIIVLLERDKEHYQSVIKLREQEVRDRDQEITYFRGEQTRQRAVRQALRDWLVGDAQ